MTPYGYALVGLSMLAGALVGLLVFAVLRFGAAARRSQRSRSEGAETAFMAAALQEALGKLRDQERAMKARAEASERLSSEIIASMTSGLLVVGADGVIKTLNPAGRRILQIGDGELPGSHRELLRDAPPLAEAVEECLATRHPIVRRTIDLRRAGASGLVATHLGVTVSPIEGADAASGAICLFTDLTAIVDLEEQLRLKESLARLGELTAGIAHEFRNGLATIHGYGRLLDPEKLPDTYRPYVRGIRDETVALGEIVQNFLNFARPADLNVTAVDVGALAHRAADEIREQAERAGGRVEVRGSFGVVEGDEVLLRQAVSNLCRNALEACLDAGMAPEIEVEGTLDPGVAQHLSVIDNGPGLDEAIRDKMFRPFFSTKPSGTGLGLAIVQKIIVTHNGRVWASSGPHPGTSLHLVLPLKVPIAASQVHS